MDLYLYVVEGRIQVDGLVKESEILSIRIPAHYTSLSAEKNEIRNTAYDEKEESPSNCS